MISRREFLVAGIRGLGSWLVGAAAARRILRLHQRLLQLGERVCLEVAVA